MEHRSRFKREALAFRFFERCKNATLSHAKNETSGAKTGPSALALIDRHVHHSPANPGLIGWLPRVTSGYQGSGL